MEEKMIKANLCTRAVLGGLMLATTAAPALAQDRFDRDGGRSGDREYRLEGRGVRELVPELRDTNRGRAFVLRNFDFNRDGLVSPREADAANRAFANVAGRDRGRFDWGRFDWDRRGRDRVVVVETRGSGAWDRGDAWLWFPPDVARRDDAAR
jgi:hypothetical protein